MRHSGAVDTQHLSPWPGLLVCLTVGLVAMGLGALAPVIGAPVLAILGGFALRELLGERPAWKPGMTFASKKILQGSVVLLGAGLSLGTVARTGLETLPVMLGTLVVALVAGRVVGGALGIDTQLRTLVTCGTAICGASAIATISAVIGAAEAAVAYSVTVIFVFNVLAAVLFPLLGHALGLSQHAFGIWAGTAVNDTSSVVAAGTTYGAVAATTAVVVKLARTLMIIPVSIVESLLHHRRTRDDGASIPWKKLVPPFLVLFLAAAGLNSIGLVPASVHPAIHQLALLGTSVAMVGIGLATPVSAIKHAGWRPLALGGSLWVLVAVSSLVLQRAVHLA